MSIELEAQQALQEWLAKDDEDRRVTRIDCCNTRSRMNPCGGLEYGVELCWQYTDPDRDRYSCSGGGPTIADAIYAALAGYEETMGLIGAEGGQGA